MTAWGVGTIHSAHPSSNTRYWAISYGSCEYPQSHVKERLWKTSFASRKVGTRK
jgi:hypothetical protein